MLSAICFDLDLSEILSSGNGLNYFLKLKASADIKTNPLSFSAQF